jgi:carboxylesterase
MDQVQGAEALETMKIPAGVTVMEDGLPFFFSGGDVGCLLIHGFTGTTSSMRPMGEYLAEKGLTVLGPRLPGHGTDVEDMARYTFGDWTTVVERALSELESICGQVFVSGLSLGGILTLYLGERYPERIAGLMPVSAPAVRLATGLQGFALHLVPALKHLLRKFPGPGNDLKDPSVTEVAYEKMSTLALHELIRLQAAVRDDLARVTSPIRIFQGREDHVVAPMNAVEIFERVCSTDKELIWLENCCHVATLDFAKEKIFEESYRFITEIAG